VTPQLVLYVRGKQTAGREVERWSEELQREYPHQLVVRDVDTNPEWESTAGKTLPVAEVDGRRLAGKLTRESLQSGLAVAQAIGAYKTETHVPKPIAIISNAADNVSSWLSRHWLTAFNGFFAIYLGLAFLAPVLMKVGAKTPANWIYTAYSFTCHQLGFRSFFLFGEEPYYPKADFALYTGVDPNDLWAARAVDGNEVLGYKVALCERCVGIYGSLLVAGLAFAFLRKRLKPLHWALWILLGVVPMGLDGGSQFLSYLPFLHFPVRESTPLLRVLTGTLFGVLSVWFAYPYVEESMEAEEHGKG
jgi:uncharacterized membrane protein